MPFVIPKWRAHDVPNWNELLVEIDGGRHDLNEATALLINYMPVVGITSLTHESAGDAWCRIAIHQALFGGLLEEKATGKTYFLTRSDVFRHIGLKTEGKALSFQEYCVSIFDARLSGETGALFFAENGNLSLLEVCGIPVANDPCEQK